LFHQKAYPSTPFIVKAEICRFVKSGIFPDIKQCNKKQRNFLLLIDLPIIEANLRGTIFFRGRAVFFLLKTFAFGRGWNSCWFSGFGFYQG